MNAHTIETALKLYIEHMKLFQRAWMDHYYGNFQFIEREESNSSDNQLR